MNGWYLGARPDLPAENEGGDLNHDSDDFLEPSIEYFCFLIRENVSFLLWILSVLWWWSYACDTRWHVFPQLSFQSHTKQEWMFWHLVLGLVI